MFSRLKSGSVASSLGLRPGSSAPREGIPGSPRFCAMVLWKSPPTRNGRSRSNFGELGAESTAPGPVRISGVPGARCGCGESTGGIIALLSLFDPAGSSEALRSSGEGDGVICGDGGSGSLAELLSRQAVGERGVDALVYGVELLVACSDAQVLQWPQSHGAQ